MLHFGVYILHHNLWSQVIHELFKFISCAGIWNLSTSYNINLHFTITTIIFIKILIFCILSPFSQVIIGRIRVNFTVNTNLGGFGITGYRRKCKIQGYQMLTKNSLNWYSIILGIFSVLFHLIILNHLWNNDITLNHLWNNDITLYHLR